DDTDQQPTDDGARETAQAAKYHHDKRRQGELIAHGWKDTVNGGHQAGGQSDGGSAKSERDELNTFYIHSHESGHHTVLSGGADCPSKVAVLEKREQSA